MPLQHPVGLRLTLMAAALGIAAAWAPPGVVSAQEVTAPARPAAGQAQTLDEQVARLEAGLDALIASGLAALARHDEQIAALDRSLAADAAEIEASLAQVRRRLAGRSDLSDAWAAMEMFGDLATTEGIAVSERNHRRLAEAGRELRAGKERLIEAYTAAIAVRARLCDLAEASGISSSSGEAVDLARREFAEADRELRSRLGRVQDRASTIRRDLPVFQANATNLRLAAGLGEAIASVRDPQPALDRALERQHRVLTRVAGEPTRIPEEIDTRRDAVRLFEGFRKAWEEEARGVMAALERAAEAATGDDRARIRALQARVDAARQRSNPRIPPEPVVATLEARIDRSLYFADPTGDAHALDLLREAVEQVHRLKSLTMVSPEVLSRELSAATNAIDAARSGLELEAPGPDLVNELLGRLQACHERLLAGVEGRLSGHQAFLREIDEGIDQLEQARIVHNETVAAYTAIAGKVDRLLEDVRPLRARHAAARADISRLAAELQPLIGDWVIGQAPPKAQDLRRQAVALYDATTALRAAFVELEAPGAAIDAARLVCAAADAPSGAGGLQRSEEQLAAAEAALQAALEAANQARARAGAALVALEPLVFEGVEVARRFQAIDDAAWSLREIEQRRDELAREYSRLLNEVGAGGTAWREYESRLSRASDLVDQLVDRMNRYAAQVASGGGTRLEEIDRTALPLEVRALLSELDRRVTRLRSIEAAFERTTVLARALWLGEMDPGPSLGRSALDVREIALDRMADVLRVGQQALDRLDAVVGHEAAARQSGEGTLARARDCRDRLAGAPAGDPIIDPDEPGAAGDPNEPAPIVVPNVEGHLLDEAIGAIRAVRLRPSVELAGETSDPARVDRVATQSPGAGERVVPESLIVLRVLAAAVARGNVPFVIGLPLQEAIARVERAGFVPVVEVGADTDDPSKEGTISRQGGFFYRDDGTREPVEVKLGGDVVLEVYARVTPGMVVPDLVGRSVDVAARMLAPHGADSQARLFLDAVVEADAPSRGDEGVILRQYPEPGLEIPRGTAVRVWIYGTYAGSRLLERPPDRPVETGGGGGGGSGGGGDEGRKAASASLEFIVFPRAVGAIGVLPGHEGAAVATSSGWRVNRPGGSWHTPPVRRGELAGVAADAGGIRSVQGPAYLDGLGHDATVLTVMLYWAQSDDRGVLRCSSQTASTRDSRGFGSAVARLVIPSARAQAAVEFSTARGEERDPWDHMPDESVLRMAADFLLAQVEPHAKPCQ